MSRLRIAYDAQLVIPPRTGLGVYAAGLLIALAEAAPPDWEITPFASSWRDPEGKRAMLSAGRFRPALWRFPDRLAFLYRWLPSLSPSVERIAGPYDVVHFPNLLGRRVARGASVIRTVHDLTFLVNPAWHRREVVRRYAAETATLAENRDRILADSQATREDLVRLAGISPERIRVAFPGLRHGFPAPPREGEEIRIRAAYGLPAERPYLLFVGTLEPRKNVPRLVQAFDSSRFARGGGVLVLAGAEGWGALEARAAIRGAVHASRVIRLRSIRDEDLSALYRGAHAFAYPSLYEGFGLPLLESLACGVPSLTTTRSSPPEIAGDAALLVPPEETDAIREAIDRLCEEGDLRRRLSEAGRKRAAFFRWDLRVRDVLDTYREAASGGRESPK